MSNIDFRNVSKYYGSYCVLDNVSFSIPSGQFLTLLGPSGCGKTTTLRAVAGFVSPSEGEILIANRRVNDIAINQRNTGMVFQNFALFPHLTVAENVAFGLRVRKKSSAEARELVRDALALVHLQQLAKRYPRELSGGEQQRVALARAVVIKPDVLLLDEPLSALDATLRLELQVQIREVQKALGLTAIYVTHDQAEALRMSDLIAVMSGGKIVQFDKPMTLYKKPRTAFVAKFIGRANLIDVTIGATNGDGSHVLVNSSDGSRFTAPFESDESFSPGTPYFLGIRPEAVKIGHDRENVVEGIVQKISYSGSVWNVIVSCANGSTLDVELKYEVTPPSVGKKASFCWSTADSFLIAP